MEGEKEGDCRVPLISSLFCLSLTAGGILLGIYVFANQHSKPWFPAVALTLIAMPWIFWAIMYFYTCIKGCFRLGVRVDDRQISRRSYTTGRKSSVHDPSVKNNNASPNDGKHVNFRSAVVTEGESNGGGGGGQGGVGDSSVASSVECEMPLKLSVAS